MGVLALSLTAIVYVPGMLLGYGILKSGMLDGIHWSASGDVLSVVDVIWGPALDALTKLPGWTLLPIGLGIILLSFRLLDNVLPQLDGERHGSGKGAWMKRPWPMFGLGCLVATLTLSVSVALTLLVPLASRGYIKREESIPYIMGANITTLADTLVAAMILERRRRADRARRGDRGEHRVAVLSRVPVRTAHALDHVARRLGRVVQSTAVVLRRDPVRVAGAVPHGIWIGPIAH